MNFESGCASFQFLNYSMAFRSRIRCSHAAAVWGWYRRVITACMYVDVIQRGRVKRGNMDRCLVTCNYFLIRAALLFF